MPSVCGAGFGVASGDAIGECDAFDDQRQLVCTLQSAPGPGGGLNELEDHQLGRFLRQRALCSYGSVPNGGEDAFDGIAGRADRRSARPESRKRRGAPRDPSSGRSPILWDDGAEVCFQQGNGFGGRPARSESVSL